VAEQALDAVTEAVRLLEDDPQFNAGRGAVLTHEGEAELDARSWMVPAHARVPLPESAT